MRREGTWIRCAAASARGKGRRERGGNGDERAGERVKEPSGGAERAGMGELRCAKCATERGARSAECGVRSATYPTGSEHGRDAERRCCTGGIMQSVFAGLGGERIRLVLAKYGGSMRRRAD